MFDVGGCRTLVGDLSRLQDDTLSWPCISVRHGFPTLTMWMLSFFVCLFPSSKRTKRWRTCVWVFSVTHIRFRSTLGGGPHRKSPGRFYYPMDLHLLFEATGENTTNSVFKQMWPAEAEVKTRHQSDTIPPEFRQPTKRRDDSCKM